jgi:cytosine/adenosine deaminase-related metal-dependent hydrolase
MPLEIWLLYAYPLLMNDPIGERLLYLRSLLLAMESLRNGVTTFCDDFFDPPRHDLDRLATVFRAYEDAGIRANVSSAVMNVHTLDALPFAREVMPPELQARLDFGPPMTAGAYMDYCRSAFSSLHGKAGRLNFMIAPSAPQRCTPDLMAACMDLAVARHVPFHTHILETKTQAVTGPVLHGKSLIAYMHDLGLLKRNTDHCTLRLGQRRGHAADGGRGRLRRAQCRLEPEARRRHRPDPPSARCRCDGRAWHRWCFLERHVAHLRRHARCRPRAQCRRTRPREMGGGA